MRSYSISILVFMVLWVPNVFASWSVEEGSVVNFVSIKNDVVGELNRFKNISGFFSDDGEIEIQISLDSVETYVDIRNSRLKSLLFEVAKYPQATIRGQLTAKALESLHAKQNGLFDVNIEISLHGKTVVKTTKIHVSHTLGRANMMTAEPILLSAAEFSLEAGVWALQEVAGLNSISQVIPVTVNLIFAPSS